MKKNILFLLCLVLFSLPSYAQQRSSDIIFDNLNLIENKTKDLLNNINLLEVNLMQSEAALNRAESALSKVEATSMRLSLQLNESEKKRKFYKTTTIALAVSVVIETAIIIFIKK